MGYLEDDIRRNVASRQLVLVVGAGVSVGASERARVASWTGLLHSGAERCAELGLIDSGECDRLAEDIKGGSADRLILAAEQIARALGAPSREYATWLADTMGKLTLKDASVISQLAKLGCRIATTNYDDILEQATGYEPVTWTEPARAQQWFNGENPRQILHLHGHWRRPESVVLGIRSYEDVLRSPFAQALLRALPFQYSLLFIGFGAGLSDPNFGPFLQWLDDVLRDTTNRHYRLVLKSEARVAARSGPPKIFLVPYGESHGELAPFLTTLLPAKPAAVEPVPATSRRFFLSYRRGGADEHLAMRLHHRLRAEGHRVDWDVDLRLGDDWAQLLRAQIEQADFFVPLLSADSIESEMVLDEVRTAWRSGKRRGNPRILPIRVGYDGPFGYELNLYLGRLHRVDHPDGSSDHDEPVIAALLDAARGIRAVSIEPRPPAAAPSAPNRQYVETAAGRRVLALARASCRALTIVGPRAFGKTHLLRRYLDTCREAGCDVIHVDLSAIESACLENYDEFLTTLSSEILTALHVYLSPPRITRQAEMKGFMQRDVLSAAARPMVLALDHLHRIIGRPYQNDFFAMLRSWQNNASEIPEWRPLRMALVVAMDPTRLIVNVLQSPFNIGERIDLKPMTLEEAHEFNAQHAPSLDAGQVDELYDLLSGHLQLTRRAYDALASGTRFGELIATAANERGPLGDHLRALWASLCKRPELIEALAQAIRRGTVKDAELGGQLCAMGILTESGERYDLANLLYARYFRRRIAQRD